MVGGPGNNGCVWLTMNVCCTHAHLTFHQHTPDLPHAHLTPTRAHCTDASVWVSPQPCPFLQCRHAHLSHTRSTLTHTRTLHRYSHVSACLGVWSTCATSRISTNTHLHPPRAHLTSHTHTSLPHTHTARILTVSGRPCPSSNVSKHTHSHHAYLTATHAHCTHTHRGPPALTPPYLLGPAPPPGSAGRRETGAGSR